MKSAACLFGLALTCLGANLASGAVTETHADGFAMESTATTRATPAAVYAALGKPGAWWHPEHTWSGSARNMSLQLQAGGCFCEKLAGGGSVQHGRVIFAQPGSQLRLDAALGPLQDMAVTGVLTFKLAAQDGGTLITMSYRVSGALTMEAATLAPVVDQVMGIQLGRLKAYSDSGKINK
jgi:uncharacterized protein YndB with AHSA1/START domain